MQQLVLAAERRESNGKGVARSLRRAGRIPAVIYGHGRDPQPLSLDHRAVGRILDIIGGEATLLDVSIDGAAPVKALVREVQRNPIQRAEVIHLDLYAVVATERITIEVPVHIRGNADGVRNHGGVLDHHIHRLPIRVLPTEIPEHIDVDVSALGVGEALHVRDLVLPHGEALLDADVPVVSVVASRAEVSATGEVAQAEPEVIRKGKADEAEAPGT